jgi:hypothetical protein
MRAMRRLALVWLLCVAASACADAKSPRCKQICDHEARCAGEDEEPRRKFDEAECVEACTLLERDAQGRKLVDRHAACVEAAATCDDVAACE